MSSIRRGGTKLQNRVVAAVALSSNKNHSCNRLGEVIRAHCYCDRVRLAATKHCNGRSHGIGPLLLWYLCENMAPFTSFTKRDCQQDLLHLILPSPTIMCKWGHMCQRTCTASEKMTGWSRKLLDIFNRVILLWVYKMVDVKNSRRGETKVWVRLKLSSVTMGMVSQRPVATVTLSSNGLGEVIRVHCYCDRACLAATERSNGRGDCIGPLLLWHSSTSHRKIYDINNKVS
jgi:hypothetical protein